MKNYFSRGIIYEKKEPSSYDAKIPLTISEIDLPELDLLKEVRFLSDQKIRQFKNRFLQKDRCFIAKNENGNIIHYSWVRTEGVMHIHHVNKKFLLKPNLNWIFDCRTNESYRGLSIYPAVISEVASRLLDYKIKVVRIDVDVANEASIRGIEKAGFLPILKVSKIFGVALLKRIR